MSNLYEILKQLCDERGITGARMCSDIGYSKNLMTELKSGRKKSLSAEVATKIASYFGVSVDYLLGKTDHKTPVSPFDDGQMQECIVLYRGGKPQVFHFSQKQLDTLASLLEQFNDNNL